MSVPNTTGSAVRFDLKSNVTWGFAALGTQMCLGVYGVLLPIFYQDYLGLAARRIAVASMIYAVWNAINEPPGKKAGDRRAAGDWSRASAAPSAPVNPDPGNIGCANHGQRRCVRRGR
jgi:hypothetical protein